MKRILVSAIGMLFVSVGLRAEEMAPPPAGKMVAKVTLVGTTPGDKINGEIRIFEAYWGKGLKFVGNITGATPGNHGIHIHDKGDCSDGGNAAGGHYNPHGTKHGFSPRDKITNAHPGDLGNVLVDQSGNGSFSEEVVGITLAGLDPVGGRAIILHEKEDDFGQPTGNAGGRIACGIIETEQDAADR